MVQCGSGCYCGVQLSHSIDLLAEGDEAIGFGSSKVEPDAPNSVYKLISVHLQRAPPQLLPAPMHGTLPMLYEGLVKMASAKPVNGLQAREVSTGQADRIATWH